MAGAVVEVSDGPTQAQATAGEDGQYELDGLAAGAYALKATAEGYLEST